MTQKGFIELGRKSGLEQPVVSSKKEIYYPSFYLDKDLGLDEKEVGKEILALVKLKVKSVEKRISENKKTDNVSFDVLGINIKPGKVSHYKS